jgi:RNA polymerase sigma factor for flagellar operon FliA
MSAVEEASRMLILSCQGLVKAIAVRVHSNAPRSVSLDDLIGYGELGLAEAARDFEPDRGVQFSTFAYYRIRGAIFDGLAKMTWPTRAQLNQWLYQRNAAEVLQADAGDGEPAECTLEEHVARFGRVTQQLFVAYLASSVDDEDAERPELAIEDDTALPPADLAARRENCHMLRELIKALPADAHQLIYSMYFEGQNLSEAAEKLGISKSWASRLHSRTLDRLAGSLRRLGVEE